ncbi:MAG: hypothetical protein ACD_65C00345G0005 [uncultured bacterium]|nr:MAG: hypothetical protein ACD_65C00345G0005 [uncultured bacterium]KKT01817.1 MAG: hypothetical protein UV80_C0008G0027 [Candidatus Peregrinibacteria bacterium GW2011_GWF2_43_17]KKT18900.1 MAG: hypothetical protein UW03_C0028G0016 [Candidatus Peregrinibacteria bacterium GW2011_GWA2_43_8]
MNSVPDGERVEKIRSEVFPEMDKSLTVREKHRKGEELSEEDDRYYGEDFQRFLSNLLISVLDNFTVVSISGVVVGGILSMFLVPNRLSSLHRSLC